MVPRWPERARQIGAIEVPAAQALPLLQALWSAGRMLPPLNDGDWERLAPRMSFHRVAAGVTLIAQDEPGDFLLALLDGSVLIEHHAAPAEGADAHGRAGGVLRLAEARPGDVVGEMALLDAGPRSSACVTRTPCLLAVLQMDMLVALLRDDSPLAAALMAALARRLSLRLRQADARLAALLASAG